MIKFISAEDQRDFEIGGKLVLHIGHGNFIKIGEDIIIRIDRSHKGENLTKLIMMCPKKLRVERLTKIEVNHDAN